MLRVFSDGSRTGIGLIFSVAGETKIVVVIRFDQLGPTRSPMRIMAVKAKNLGLKMSASLGVEPLLVMGS
jgi:hypothetical protein